MHRSRAVGIGGLQRVRESNDSLRAAGAQLDALQLAEVASQNPPPLQMKTQLDVFRSNLEEFARKHRQDIQKNPDFRAKFQEMCNNIGVDPLASNKGFWSELLGVGNFYYDLGIQTITVCYKTRSRNGGLIDLSELVKLLKEHRGKRAEPISEYDVVRAIKTVTVLGKGFGLVTVGQRQMVQSVPMELNGDLLLVLSQAEAAGFVTASKLASATGWEAHRIEVALMALVKSGMAWIDSQGREPEYWIPSYFSNSRV